MISCSPGARVEEFMHEFFLVCNQNMPVAGKTIMDFVLKTMKSALKTMNYGLQS